MTFSITVPNATQSPSVFPAQNNTNFDRLKLIINADHNFTDTTSTAEGAHNQVTFIDRSAPVAVPVGTNSMMYSTSDVGSTPLPNFYDGSQNYQLPFSISGQVSLANGASSVVFTSAKTFIGTGLVTGPLPLFSSQYRLLDSNIIVAEGSIVNSVTIFNTAGSVSITNNTGALATLSYSLIFNVVA